MKSMYTGDFGPFNFDDNNNNCWQLSLLAYQSQVAKIRFYPVATTNNIPAANISSAVSGGSVPRTTRHPWMSTSVDNSGSYMLNAWLYLKNIGSSGGPIPRRLPSLRVSWPPPFFQAALTCPWLTVMWNIPISITSGQIIIGTHCPSPKISLKGCENLRTRLWI
jgi:hypothetical protein